MISTKKEAKALGLKRFFTGKPCKYGHISERDLRGGCIKCRPIYQKEWRDRNVVKMVAYRKQHSDYLGEYRRKNKERLAAHRRSQVTQNILRSARHRAKENGLECTISIRDIVIPELCPLLDIPLIRGNGVQTQNSPSLDRIDNSKGYVPGNVWVISYLANTSKGNLTVDQLIQIGSRLKAKIESGQW